MHINKVKVNTWTHEKKNIIEYRKWKALNGKDQNFKLVTKPYHNKNILVSLLKQQNEWTINSYGGMDTKGATFIWMNITVY